jgi:beta-glucosidase
LGAFEKEENVAYFVDFAKKMYLEYGKKVNFWCTLNEPEVIC